jgi:nicotinate-nucleotide pyrophosphorylase (carboxylating)
LRNLVKIEISGGVTLDNIINYAKLKPDIISIGYLTHSAPSLDFSLKIKD